MISLFFLLLASDSWACKPAPLSFCDKPEILLREAAFDELNKKSIVFQKALTNGIIESDKKGVSGKKATADASRTSCFNNNFAVFYLERINDYAQKHAKMICAHHLDFIDNQVKHLIDPSTIERKAVTIAKHQQKLKKLSVEVNKALDNFQGEHSK